MPYRFGCGAFTTYYYTGRFISFSLPQCSVDYIAQHFRLIVFRLGIDVHRDLAVFYGRPDTEQFSGQPEQRSDWWCRYAAADGNAHQSPSCKRGKANPVFGGAAAQRPERSNLLSVSPFTSFASKILSAIKGFMFWHSFFQKQMLPTESIRM